MKKYLFTYGPSLGTRDKLTEVLNGMKEIKGWRYDIPNSFYIFTELNAKDLVNRIRQACGGKGRCIAVAMEDYHGWLPHETWEYMKKVEEREAEL